MTCAVDGCDRPSRARGWCGMHWQRWRRNGDPTVLVGRGRPRKDTWDHGSRRGYQQGCRCFPCRLAENRYQRALAEGNFRRVPAETVAAYLQELVESGWTKAEIRRAADLGNSTISHILGGKSSNVNSRVAASVLALRPYETGPRWLDPRPLVAAIEATGTPLYQLLDEGDRRAFYRARAEGRITEEVADRLAIRALGLTLELIYGLEVTA